MAEVLARPTTAMLMLGAVTIAGALAGGAAADGERSTSVRTAALATMEMERVVSARVHHTWISTVRNSNVRRIGRSIASLRPTWVTGTLRYASDQHPKRIEIRAWNEMRRIVRGQTPGTQFDVVLNAMQYRDPKAIRSKMRRLRARLGNEGWFFDFFSTAFRARPRTVRAAIASAHAHGEWIGGNVFGLTRRRALPARADFLSVQDADLRLNLRAVRRLAATGPVLYHLHSDPTKQRGGGCRFIERLGPGRRRALIRQRARQQARYGFRVSYPALFPQCLRARRRGAGSFLYSYNAFRDPPMAHEIARLLDLYDYDPAT